jgi:hypothetical protein
MLNFAPELKIYLHAGPVDMRKSYDGLFGIVSTSFERDVRDGGLFLFINRRRDRLKLLYWDTDGLAIWMKKEEAEYTHFFIFTEVGGTHSLSVFVTPTRQMGRRKRRRSARRKEMPAKQARIDPPRA